MSLRSAVDAAWREQVAKETAEREAKLASIVRKHAGLLGYLVRSRPDWKVEFRCWRDVHVDRNAPIPMPTFWLDDLVVITEPNEKSATRLGVPLLCARCGSTNVRWTGVYLQSTSSVDPIPDLLVRLGRARAAQQQCNACSGGVAFGVG